VDHRVTTAATPRRTGPRVADVCAHRNCRGVRPKSWWQSLRSPWCSVQQLVISLGIAPSRRNTVRLASTPWAQKGRFAKARPAMQYVPLGLSSSRWLQCLTPGSKSKKRGTSEGWHSQCSPRRWPGFDPTCRPRTADCGLGPAAPLHHRLGENRLAIKAGWWKFQNLLEVH
jgi:hypothetical protein